jgi:hypothetical protein
MGECYIGLEAEAPTRIVEDVVEHVFVDVVELDSVVGIVARMLVVFAVVPVGAADAGIGHMLVAEHTLVAAAVVAAVEPGLGHKRGAFEDTKVGSMALRRVGDEQDLLDLVLSIRDRMLGTWAVQSLMYTESP